MEDLAAMQRGLCTKEEKEKCLVENDGDLSWACSNCPKKKESDIHPYTIKLLSLRRLQLAGYPFTADDLTLEEWGDLGWLNETLNRDEKRNEFLLAANIHRSR